MELTKEEEELILKKKAEEEAEKPKMIGELKEDLYMNNCLNDDGKYYAYVPWFCSADERDGLVVDFADSFEKVLDAGAIFDCYIEKDGRESWYDRDFGIEGMDKGWAREYLTNIREV